MKTKSKAVYELDNKTKSTFFSLIIYDIVKKIHEVCGKWFDGVFNEKIVPESIYTGNLLADLDYMFSEGVWIGEHAKANGWDVTDAYKHLLHLLKIYRNGRGFKRLVAYNINQYDWKNNRVFTQEELDKRAEEMNRIAKEIIDEMIAEGKFGK